MSFNSWERLAKAQTDYPKPKFAVAVVDKALKKNPKNPFLLAWRVDLYLQLNNDPKLALERLGQIVQGDVLTDVRLLSYMYRLSIAATRKVISSSQGIGSVGTELLKPWQNAAKKMERRNDRLQLWDALFDAAMRGDCWEDVRFAVINYNKESLVSKKQGHYTLILALELAASQKDLTSKPNDPIAKMQHALARKMMKQSYEASKDDPIAIKEIRDLRFMANIFGRQGQSEELFVLWENPPEALQALMKTHQEDLISIKTKFLRQEKKWPLLQEHCMLYIKNSLAKLQTADDPKTLWELCAWRWDLWDALLAALANTPDSDRQAIDETIDIIHQSFGSKIDTKDRPIHLLRLSWRKFIGSLNLSDCNQYWECHSRLPSCFSDLRPFVESLSLKEHMEFCEFIRGHTKDVIQKASVEKWQVAELNVLKFTYLLTISLPKSPSLEALETLVTKVIDFCILCPKVSDGGFLAIYTLLHLHHKIICGEHESVPEDSRLNTRILLQATVLAHHLVTSDTNKDNRTLCLLAARLHLNLGLGQCAFKLYNHARCKEMLLDTLSPYLLSRISLTHPFSIKGRQGFSPAEELVKTIGTIEKMEQKTKSYIYMELPSFYWDGASDALDLKHRLNSSLTKHICVAERYRIARLRGDSTERFTRLDYETYMDISDNVDKSVFPNFESTESAGPLALVMPSGMPNVKWILDSLCDWEAPSRTLHKEGDGLEHEAWRTDGSLHSKQKSDVPANKTRAETRLEPSWKYIRLLTSEAFSIAKITNGNRKTEAIESLQLLIEEIKVVREAMKNLCKSKTAKVEPENETPMFHENMLMFCYTTFEVLRATHKLVEQLEKIRSPKSTHVLKAKLSAQSVTDLAKETQSCFAAIQDVAKSYMTRIKTRGEVAIKAQVGWGKTGKALMELIGQDSLHGYAKEYVDSALEAWNGVLSVKLK